MALGIIGTAMAGAMEGAGRSAAPLAKYASDSQLQAEAAAAQEKRDQRLSELRKGEAVFGEDLRRGGKKADFEFETDPANVARKGAAAAGLIEAQIPAEVAKKKALGEVDTQQKVDEFTRLAPLQRQEAITTAVERLKALSTPEALRAERAIAQAKHIVDPQYTLIPNADGTVTTFDIRSGKSTGAVKDADGKPIIRKDPEELKAATSIINMANSNLRIAEAAYKAGKDDMDPAVKAAAVESWNQAQAEARRLTAPAYAVLYGKSGATDPGPASSATTNRPPLSSFGGPRPATTPAKGGATNGGAANEGPRPNADAGVSTYGPLTPWDTIEKQARAGDQAAIKYAKERIAKGPGIIGVTPPESLTEFLKGK